MKSNKRNFVFALLFILASCGGPHLVQDQSQAEADDGLAGDSTVSEFRIEEVVEKSVAQDLVIEDAHGADELEFGILPIGLDISKRMSFTNNTDKDLDLTVIFEKGVAFEFSGGTFPGVGGTCSKILKAKESCQVTVSFIGNDANKKYEDRLVVKLYDKTLKREIVEYVPLFGERLTTKAKLETSKITLAQNSNVLNFDQVEVGQSLVKNILLQNTFDTNVQIQEIRVSQNAPFVVTNQNECLNKDLGSCSLSIEFKPSQEKSYQSVVYLVDNQNGLLELQVTGDGLVKKVGACVEKSIDVKELRKFKKKNPEIIASLLPYEINQKKTKLTKLYGVQTNFKVKNVVEHSVKDALVYTKYAMPNLAGKNISDIELGLDLFKITTKTHNDTEMICLVSEKIKKCSGRFFDSKNWLKLKNKKFWTDDKILANEKYDLVRATKLQSCGTGLQTCEYIVDTFSAKELFELNADELKEFATSKNVYIILSDDTRNMSMPKLKFKYVEGESCR